MNPKDEARAILMAQGDQLISALTEDSSIESLTAFKDAIKDMDDFLKELGIDDASRMTAIVGATARCLLERYGQA